MNSSQNRFLAIRLSSLGDLVHNLPVVPALRRAFPEARIDWLVDERWSPLMSLVGGIDEVIPLRPSIKGHWDCVRRLRNGRYSCVIDFQGIYRSAILGWCSGAPRRIGRARNSAREPGAATFYTEQIVPSGTHVAEMSISLAAHAGALTTGQLEFPITVPGEESATVREKLLNAGINDYLVVSPGGGWRSKCWPEERFGALCAELMRRYRLRAVINVAPKEMELGRAIQRCAGTSQPLIYGPELRELVALMAHARIVLGGDTGPVHLAAALGTRVVALFGATNRLRNGPLPRGVVVQNHSAEPANYRRGDYARGHTYSQEMLSISLEQVLAAVEHELGVPLSR